MIGEKNCIFGFPDTFSNSPLNVRRRFRNKKRFLHLLLAMLEAEQLRSTERQIQRIIFHLNSKPPQRLLSGQRQAMESASSNAREHSMNLRLPASFSFRKP